MLVAPLEEGKGSTEFYMIKAKVSGRELGFGSFFLNGEVLGLGLS
jgi:hypothetical protein